MHKVVIAFIYWQTKYDVNCTRQKICIIDILYKDFFAMEKLKLLKIGI